MSTANQVPNNFWEAPVDELLRSLGSSSGGLASGEAIQHLEQYGPNVLQVKAQVTTLGLFLRQFQSPIMLILLLATLASAFLKDWPDAVIILVIVLGSALLSFVQEHNASQAVEKLRGQLTLKASVLRDGQPQSIPVDGPAFIPNMGAPKNPVPADAASIARGQERFDINCTICHGPQGKDDVPNPGSDDGTVPPLNPIDSLLVDPDYKTFATNIDLFIQHGSRPEGPSPYRTMPGWGDKGAITQQQIAAVIAYIISLNK